MSKITNIWERNYKKKRYNSYPYDKVVSIILRTYPIKKSRKKIKVLGLGCGGGNNTEFLAKEGFDVYAVDGSKEAINLTKKRVSKLVSLNKIVKSDFESLPFKNNFFDFILDRQSLGHNNKRKIYLIVNEIERLLKKRGNFLSFIFSSKHPHKKYGKIINLDKRKDKNSEDLHNFKKGIFKKSGLVHFFTLKEIKKIFKNFQFIEIIEEKSRSMINSSYSIYNTNEYTIFLKKK